MSKKVLWRVFTHSFSLRWRRQIERKDHLYCRSICEKYVLSRNIANVLQFIVKDQTHERDKWKRKSRKHAVCVGSVE